MPGGRLDAAHLAAAAWARKRGIAPASLLDSLARQLAAPVPAPVEVPGAIDTTPTPARTPRRGRGRPVAGAGPATASETDHSQPRDVTDLLDLTLRELTSQHGSVQGFSDWLATRKLAADTARIESRNDRDAGRLISSELVSTIVFGMIDGQNRRLLANPPRTIAIRAMAAARSGGTLEDLIVLGTAAISAELRVTVAKARRAIRACKTGDNPPEVSAPEAESKNFAEIRAFSHDLTARLRTEMIPIVVDFLLKQVVQAASGERWNRALADEVMATKTALAPEAVRVIGNMLEAHIRNAVLDEINKERTQ